LWASIFARKLFIFTEMCRQELTSDNVGEDEIEDELALVRAQLAYAMQMSGKPMSQIVDLYARIVKSK
jgi:hypothetical protein